MARSAVALLLAAFLGLVLTARSAHAEDRADLVARIDVGTSPMRDTLTRTKPLADEGLTAAAASSGVLYRATPGQATRPAPRKDWSGVVAAYMWATDISGTSYADGEATDIDIAFDDLFDKLDYAFMGYAEARYKRWSLALDGSIVSLAASRTGPAGAAQLGAELEQTILDVRLGYTVFCRQRGSDRWGRCCYPRGMTLDAIVGARYWSLEQEISVAIVGGPIVTRESTENWVDPYVGARFRWQFAKRWGLSVYGDVGGFGISDASSLTWMFQAHVRYFITRGLFLSAGYRALEVDRVEGSGATQNGIDATYHGPILGLGYAF